MIELGEPEAADQFSTGHVRAVSSRRVSVSAIFES